MDLLTFGIALLSLLTAVIGRLIVSEVQDWLPTWRVTS
jgi:hypothetical protein